MKFKEIKKLGEKEREKKFKELKMELIKSKVNASKTGSAKTKNIRKIIARMLTLNTEESKNSKEVLNTK